MAIVQSQLIKHGHYWLLAGTEDGQGMNHGVEKVRSAAPRVVEEHRNGELDQADSHH